MNTQIIEKPGRKKFAMIPYKEFIAMRKELENYQDLKALRLAKADPRNRKGRLFQEAAKDLGLLK
ncbi:MAG TPA: hypothetical protein VNV14_07600 [Opitutaceae bacterium]|nr:hypothetical protein [Opitutaceae bacterium]